MSGSMPVVSQSIMKLIVPVGANTVAWALRKPYFSPICNTSSHSFLAACFSSGGTVVIDRVTRFAVHLHHAQHRLFVLGVTIERSDHAGQLGTGAVRFAVQQRGQRSTDSRARLPSRKAARQS